jgi:hypothetical protein
MLEVAQPPMDLRPPVGGRCERQDRVMEGLRHAVTTGIALHEAAVGHRVSVLHPARQCRPEVPRHRAEVAFLGVRSIAVGADALVPVAGGRRSRVDRHRAGERIEPWRLVEVAVDDERGTRHACAAA